MDNSQRNNVEQGKTIAIIAYITLFGLIAAFVMNSSKSNQFAKFHIRQNVGLLLIGLIAGALGMVPVVGSIISGIVGLAIFILWLIGLLGALKGEEKEVPYIGEQIQKNLASI